jgi:hypothetical protein
MTATSRQADPADIDTLLQAVWNGDTPRSIALATLNAVGLHSDETWAQMEEALDLLALRDRILDPQGDWDVYSHLDRHPVPGVEKARLERYALDCVESDLRALVRDIAGCPLGVVREAS